MNHKLLLEGEVVGYIAMDVKFLFRKEKILEELVLGEYRDTKNDVLKFLRIFRNFLKFEF